MEETQHDKPTENTVPGNPQDPALVVQALLQQMQNRFEQMSSSIIGRIDEMSDRIDQLEKSIENLMNQTGAREKDK